MTGTTLKTIAMATMLIDHIGCLFFPEQLLFRLIGRISFPIFAFLIAEGYVHTSSPLRYLLRLLLFAVFSEIPYDLAFAGAITDWNDQNIFWTLAIGLLAVWIFDVAWKKRPWLSVGAVAALAGLCEILHGDYGAYGVLLIFLFFLCRENRPVMWLGFAGLSLVQAGIYAPIQTMAIGAVVFLWLYHGQRGKPMPKYLYYGFYPAHLLILYGIQLAI